MTEAEFIRYYKRRNKSKNYKEASKRKDRLILEQPIKSSGRRRKSIFKKLGNIWEKRGKTKKNSDTEYGESNNN